MRWSKAAIAVGTALAVGSTVGTAVALSLPIRTPPAAIQLQLVGEANVKDAKPSKPPEYPPDVRKCNSWIKIKTKGNLTIYMIHTSCKKWWGWSRPTIKIKYWSGGQEQTVTAVPDVDADGTANSVVNLDSTQLAAGQTVSITFQARDANGTLYSETVELVVPGTEAPTLTAKAATVKNGLYRTSVSSSPDGQNTGLTYCPGPFTFRIQKQESTVTRSTGKPVEEQIWTSLPDKYTTTEGSDAWHHSTVKLAKGTYRSVIYGQCGLLGGTTNAVTVK